METIILFQILQSVLILCCSEGFIIRIPSPPSAWTKLLPQKREHNCRTQSTNCNAVPKAWSSIASVNNQSSLYGDCIGDVMLQTQIDKKVTASSNNRTYHLASPREWMEYIDATENNEGGGSYTVIRCDLVSEDHVDADDNDDSDSRERIFQEGVTDNCSMKWSIWGQEFHIDRLQSSFCSLIQQKQSDVDSSRGYANLINDEKLNNSVAQSKKMIDALLTEAESLMKQEKNVKPELIQTVMLTLFWTPNIETESNTITVRGHACFAGGGQNYDPLKYEPDPITVTIATPPPPLHPSEEKLSVGSNSVSSFLDLPNRYMHRPNAKLSSWCRIRCPLERPSFFKPSGVGEVILTKPPIYGNDNNIDEYGLLEGLTSNLFVVYRDETIRTASENLVLSGYVRHLILNLAISLGLKMDTVNPIKVQDSKDGLWVEAFVTSSIRLVVPIGKVMILANIYNNESLEKEKDEGIKETQKQLTREMTFDTLWTRDMVKDGSSDGDFWKILYNEMLKTQRIRCA